VKKIFLIEPNPYHTEVLPGIVKYFSDIQYTVDVYIQNKLLMDNAFCLYPEPINLHGYDFHEIKSLLGLKNISEYDFVFFSSMEFTTDGGIYNIIQHLGFIPVSKYGVLAMYHTTSHIDYFEDHNMGKEGRLFCISPFQMKKYSIKSLTPVFFGADRKLTSDSKDSIICVGNAFDGKMLGEALRKMPRKKNMAIPKIHLYGRRHSNNTSFRKHMILKLKSNVGRLMVRSKVLCSLSSIFISENKKNKIIEFYYMQKYVKKKGGVSFNKLFAEIMKNKYALVLINPRSKNHEHYMSYTTSGIKQIILGFNRVPIIHKQVAEKYGFNNSNSITFDDTSLGEVLLSLDDKKYMDKFLALRQLQEQIFSQSLHNLKITIDNIISANFLYNK